jgi:aquaporin Z
MEAVCLGVFMASASVFATLIDYPGSPVRQAIDEPLMRRCLMGIAMGVTASLLIYSPMGKLSGAHMNPAVSVTFFRLNKISLLDTLFYILFQCAGGILSVMLMEKIIGEPFTDRAVNYVQTLPGESGPWAAFAVEILIAFVMMTVVLVMSNHPLYSKYTGIFCGILVAIYVVISGPISGFSMNPARTLASAVPAMNFTALWIYMIAPFSGMLLAAELYTFRSGRTQCAKLYHSPSYLCIFKCGYCKHQNNEA